MVTWTIFKNRFLEVGLTRNWGTMALWTLATVDLLYFYHVWGPTWIESRWNSIWQKAQSHMASHYTWGTVTKLHELGGELGRPLDTFFWALTTAWSRLMARVWSDPNYEVYCSAREVSIWAYIVGQDPSDSKPNRLHVDIFWWVCCFIHLRCIFFHRFL